MYRILDVVGYGGVGGATDSGRAVAAPLGPRPPECAEDPAWAGFRDSLAKVFFQSSHSWHTQERHDENIQYARQDRHEIISIRGQHRLLTVYAKARVAPRKQKPGEYMKRRPSRQFQLRPDATSRL